MELIWQMLSTMMPNNYMKNYWKKSDSNNKIVKEIKVGKGRNNKIKTDKEVQENKKKTRIITHKEITLNLKVLKDKMVEVHLVVMNLSNQNKRVVKVEEVLHPIQNLKRNKIINHLEVVNKLQMKKNKMSDTILIVCGMKQ